MSIELDLKAADPMRVNLVGERETTALTAPKGGIKLAIVIGHTSKSGGARRKDTKENEYSWNSRLAKVIAELAPMYDLDVKIFRRKAGVSYYQQIKKVYASVDRWKADASIELHFNSSAKPRAAGTEMLSSGSTRSLALAASVQGQMVGTLGLKDRGVKVRDRTERGGLSLHKGKAPAIIGEPFFGSNTKGVLASDSPEDMKEVAKAYLYGAMLAMKNW